MKRPADLVPPGAVAVSSGFEPPRGLDGFARALTSAEAKLRDRPYRRSDLPAWALAYPPQMGGVKQIPLLTLPS